MSVKTYQAPETGLWGYQIYESGKYLGGSSAIYESAAEARREGFAAIAESDTFF